MAQPGFLRYRARVLVFIGAMCFVFSVLQGLEIAPRVITPGVTYMATAAILVIWLGVKAYIRISGRSLAGIRRFGPQSLWVVAGLLAVLWGAWIYHAVAWQRVLRDQSNTLQITTREYKH